MTLPGCPPGRLRELLEPIADRASHGKFDLSDTVMASTLYPSST